MLQPGTKLEAFISPGVSFRVKWIRRKRRPCNSKCSMCHYLIVIAMQFLLRTKSEEGQGTSKGRIGPALSAGAPPGQQSFGSDVMLRNCCGYMYLIVWS